jgi:hypothetical protein
MTTMAMTFTTNEPSKRDKPVVNKESSILLFSYVWFPHHPFIHAGGLSRELATHRWDADQ